MRVVAMAAIITSLAVPALAQGGDPSKTEANKAEERKKKESDEVGRTRTCSKERLTDNLPRKQARGTRGEIHASLPLRAHLQAPRPGV
jgi:hypothetical protein